MPSCNSIAYWVWLKRLRHSFSAFEEFYSLFQAKYLKQISLDYQAQGS